MKLRPPTDAGFSLVETLTSIAIMGVVMTALTTFFVSTTRTINVQRAKQMAVQLAQSEIEVVRAIPAASLVKGRSQTAVLNQVNTDTVPGLDVKSLLGVNVLDLAFDSSYQPTDTAPLPLTPQTNPFNNTNFTKHWFVGKCMIALAGKDACLLPSVLGSLTNMLSFYRVVVAVTWQNSRGCPGGTCSYYTETLISAQTTDPVFNPSVTVTPPLPDNPGNQVSELTVPIVPLALTATTMYPPLTWAADGLPPGVTINDAGLVTGTPTTAGTYVVRVIVTDKADDNDASFNWTVNPLPAITQPPDQTWDAGSAASYTVPLTGGTANYTWSATGLPAGLTIAPTTGVITGTSTATGATAAATVKVTVVDKFLKSATATFKWNTKVAVQYPNGTVPIALAKGVAYAGSVVGAGGTGVYTWTSPNMPTGLTLSTAGLVSGTLNGQNVRYLVTLNIADSSGATNTMLVPVNVTVTTGLRVTAPTAAAPDKTGTKGTAITSWTATATGGTTPLSWSATNLPPGIALNAATGAFTGTPTTTGTYVVNMLVTDKVNATSSFAFVWKIS